MTHASLYAMVAMTTLTVAQSSRFRVKPAPPSGGAAPSPLQQWSPYDTECVTPFPLNSSAVCNGVEYDFSQIKPPQGSAYFHAETYENNDFYFEMEGNGLPASIPGCSFQKGQNKGNVGGLAVGTNLCFSTGKLATQTWYLNATSDPMDQVVTVVFTGGQQGLATKLEVTCDPEQVEPLFPTTLPAQTDPSIVVVPVRSKYACNNSPTRAPSIDDLPYCPDECSADWSKCITAAADYTARECLDFANKGFLCKSTSLLKCDATGFLKKQPLCPGQMRFVSCTSCKPTCQTPEPADCDDECEPGCKCPPDTPIWDEAIASCVSEEDCPRTGDCDQAIVKNYLGMPIADAFCPSRAQGAICRPSCEHNICVPRPSFEGRDKYAALCATLDKTDCGARKEAGGPNEWSHRCIWADPDTGEDPSFECNGGHWELTDPGSCPIGADGSPGIVGPACRALSASQCLAQQECDARDQCAVAVQQVAEVCKFPCIGVESGSQQNMVQCARCVYMHFGTNGTTPSGSAARRLRVVKAPPQPRGLGVMVEDEERYGPAASTANVTSIQTCCGCLSALFSQLPGGFIPTDVLPTVMQSPCKMHDPLQDDDANMDDDEVQNTFLGMAGQALPVTAAATATAAAAAADPSFIDEPLEWISACIADVVESVSAMFC